MIISARELNRATLGRQLLLEREPLTVADGLRRVVALQAQHPASPYVALWNRLAGFSPSELDAAFSGGSAVKATLMRITLHAVHAEDYPAFRAAMQPTLYASRLGGRFAAAGLTPSDADALLPGLLAFAGRPRTSAEMQAWAGERVGAERRDAAWWGLKGYAPLHHAPTGPPWSFGHRPSFVTAGTAGPTGTAGAPGPDSPTPTPTPTPVPVPASRAVDPYALRTLVLRYLAGFGPASVADVAQFAMVQRAPVRAALRALDGAVEELRGPDGGTLYDLPGAPRPAAETPAPPRLMAMWDSILLAYADRGRVIPPEYRPLVIRRNGDVLPTLLVDGHVAGVWRPTEHGVEATAFRPLPPAVWDGLAEEARSLTAFLGDREAAVYSRYHHWWAKFPEAEVRML
ncbi:winged helix DNA-binding domain-containing protein [Streptomyces sp. NPDC085524]|uniref:winged helix DNA-binding domain-containing protein n=1 Tax=Streptomyces sp. NPDC085524 TaxID=3365728 RepID=UPI0037D52BFE